MFFLTIGKSRAFHLEGSGFQFQFICDTIESTPRTADFSRSAQESLCANEKDKVNDCLSIWRSVFHIFPSSSIIKLDRSQILRSWLEEVCDVKRFVM